MIIHMMMVPAVVLYAVVTPDPPVKKVEKQEPEKEVLDKPDLQIGDVRLPNIFLVERDVPVSFDVINRGFATGQAVWLDRVMLSLDETLSEEDQELLAGATQQ